jgi:hypothetical protein
MTWAVVAALAYPVVFLAIAWAPGENGSVPDEQQQRLAVVLAGLAMGATVITLAGVVARQDRTAGRQRWWAFATLLFAVYAASASMVGAVVGWLGWVWLTVAVGCLLAAASSRAAVPVAAGLGAAACLLMVNTGRESIIVPVAVVGGAIVAAVTVAHGVTMRRSDNVARRLWPIPGLAVAGYALTVWWVTRAPWEEEMHPDSPHVRIAHTVAAISLGVAVTLLLLVLVAAAMAAHRARHPISGPRGGGGEPSTAS